MIHYTYQTKNHVNGKTYVGVHSTDDINDGYLGSGTNLKKAIKKYGRENFSSIPLDFFDTRAEAFKEEEFIVNEKWVESKDNYNVATGGKSCYGIAWNKNLTGIYSKETLKKMSDAAKKRVVSDETKKKMSESSKGQVSPMLGKKHNDASKASMSINRTGAKNGKSKQVLDKETGIYYDTLTEASIALNVRVPKLSQMLTGVKPNNTSLYYV